MTPKYFTDIRFNGKPSPRSASAIMQRLHWAFGKWPGRYALALPDYPRTFPRLRVFAETAEHLDALVEEANNIRGFKKLAFFQYPRAVPDDFEGSWRVYRRYQIPSRKSERDENGNLRMRRIEFAHDMQLPYFMVRSRSSGSAFSLHVIAEDATEDGTRSTHDGDAGEAGHEPDKYGLASKKRWFALPTVT